MKNANRQQVLKNGSYCVPKHQKVKKATERQFLKDLEIPQCPSKERLSEARCNTHETLRLPISLTPPDT